MVAQKLLEAVFGDAAIRALAARARDELQQRAERLLTDERARFDARQAFDDTLRDMHAGTGNVTDDAVTKARDKVTEAETKVTR